MIPERVEIFMKLMIVVFAMIVLIPLCTWMIRRVYLNKISVPSYYKAEAKAIVLTVEPTGLYLNKQPQVKLQMQVLPEKGRNFVAEIKTVFTPADLDGIHAGSTLTVKYNPSNTKEIILITAA